MVKMMTVQREKRTARPQTEGRGTPHTLQPQPNEMANKTVYKGQQTLTTKSNQVPVVAVRDTNHARTPEGRWRQRTKGRR